MVRIEDIDVYGWEAAIRGMRNPKNSWALSDTKTICNSNYLCENCKYAEELGNKDLLLMKKLVKAGTDHSKFMRMIIVTCDITAPLYWWKEMDTYKVGTVRNSCSTMHKIAEKEFSLDDFSTEKLFPAALEAFKNIVDLLNYYRASYLNFDEFSEESKKLFKYGEVTKKGIWWQLIQLLPSSYNQRATWQANYAVLRNIYHARKNHKLDEWKTFCNFIKSLPYSELITDEEPLLNPDNISTVNADTTNSDKNDLKEKITPETICAGILDGDDWRIKQSDLPTVRKNCIYYQPEGVKENHEYCCYNGHPLNSNEPTFGGCIACDKYITLAQMIEDYKGE